MDFLENRAAQADHLALQEKMVFQGHLDKRVLLGNLENQDFLAQREKREIPVKFVQPCPQVLQMQLDFQEKLDPKGSLDLQASESQASWVQEASQGQRVTRDPQV